MENEVKIIIADIALNFSSIEYSCTKSLSYMINNDPLDPLGNILGIIAIQDMHLEQTLQKLKKVVELKYNKQADFKNYILGIIKDISELKSTRNKFIHGLWSFKEKIECNEMRWKKDKNTGDWHSCEKKIYTIRQLRTLRDKTSKTSKAASQMVIDVFSGRRN